ncbi:MAG: alkaline phosphatase family protein [Terriglobales bacterium]
MKSTAKAVVLLTLSFTLFGTVLALAQPSNPYFEHVIIVIQENRTPDNLFGAAEETPYPSLLPSKFQQNLSKYDLALPQLNGQQSPGAIPWCLGACNDPNHLNSAWQDQNGLLSGQPYNECASGRAVGGCNGTICDKYTVCINNSSCTQYQQEGLQTLELPQSPACPQDTHVSGLYDANENNFGGMPPVYPYFDIADKYGFANYFFQTNQGDSQPAHDFLFGGTSAPAGSNALGGFGYGIYYQDFAANNPNSGSNTTDCDYASGTGQEVPLISPSATLTGVSEYPCFDHLTLADLLTNNGKTWKYYARSYKDLWNAPSGIAHLCEPDWMTLQNPFPFACETYDQNSGGDLYTASVVVPSENFFAQIEVGGTNLPGGDPQGYCILPNVTWIIPNGTWSDHPGVNSDSWENELGPDWVADIINAVGNAGCIDKDTGNPPWLDTVIFVVWDDWGGWFDHVHGTMYPVQPQVQTQQENPTYPCYLQQDWGCGYTYGSRVPFLVVSQYTPAGYVSGDCTQSQSGDCPNTNIEYYHDFGSILAFIENNFGLGIGCINGNLNNQSNSGATCNNGGASAGAGSYGFADANYAEQSRGNQYLPLAGCGKTRFEADAVPRNSLVSTAQPDKKKACAEKTSNRWTCSATSAPSSEFRTITPCALFVS